jgi:hypothetical protein
VRLGITATPHRADDDQTLRLFRWFNPAAPAAHQSEASAPAEPIFRRTLHELKDETEGHPPERVFARAEYKDIETNAEIDIRGVKSDVELKKVKGFDTAERVSKIAAAYDATTHRPALFFAVDISDANAITEALLNRKPPVKAQAIHSGTTVKGELFDQDRALSRLQRSTAVKLLRDPLQSGLDAVVSVDMFIEGLDVPCLKSVFLARPTFSRRVYLQMRGRGLRGPAVGGTDTCQIIGIRDNFRRHERRDLEPMTEESALRYEAEGVDAPGSSSPLLPPPPPITSETLREYIAALDNNHYDGIRTMSDSTGYSVAQIKSFVDGTARLPVALEEKLEADSGRWGEVYPPWAPPPIRIYTPKTGKRLAAVLKKLESVKVDKEGFGEACGVNWKDLMKACSRKKLKTTMVAGLRDALKAIRAERY